MIIVKDAISTKLCQICLDEIDGIKDWRTSTVWEAGLQEGYTGVCHIADVSANTKIKILASVRKYLPKISNDNYVVQYHDWKIGSGIQWHTDDVYKFGATIYLNEWNQRWGGLFLYKVGDMILGCMPEPRKLVCIENVPHSVTPILSHAPVSRKAVQIFGCHRYSYEDLF